MDAGRAAAVAGEGRAARGVGSPARGRAPAHARRGRGQLEAVNRATEAQRVEAVKAQMRALPNYSLYCRTQRVTLAEHDPVRRYLVGRFLGTAVGHRCQYSDDVRRAPRFDVVRVEQLRNPRLQKKYVAGLQQMAGLERQATPMQLDALHVQTFGSVNQNEFLLYHGAPSDTCEHLALQGLDPRYAGCHRGKMFGVGTYLASNSSKSDLYTKPNAAGERCVLVVRAALGEAHVEKLETVERAREVRRWLMPPQRADGRGPLSSVVAATRAQGGAVDHPEFVVRREPDAPAVRHLVPALDRLLLHALRDGKISDRASPVGDLLHHPCGVRTAAGARRRRGRGEEFGAADQAGDLPDAGHAAGSAEAAVRCDSVASPVR